MENENARSSLELLYSVSRDLANEIELRPLIKRILVQAVRNVGAERGSLVILNDQGKAVDAAIIYGEKIYTHTLPQMKETLEKGLAGWVIRHHKCVLVNDTREDQRWVRRPDDETTRSGSKSALCVPLIAHRKLVGVLTVVHPSISFFLKGHLYLLQSIADIAAIAIINAQLYEESQRRNQIMTALIENAIALNSSLKMDDVFQRLMEQTTQALGAEIAALGLLDATCENVEFQAAFGKDAATLQNAVFPIGTGLIYSVLKEDRAYISSPDEITGVDLFSGFPVRSLAMSPVRVKGKTLGIILAVNPREEEFGPETLTVLDAMGNMAGTAIQNARNYEQAESSSQRYGELFDHHVDPIVITDLNGMILEANCQACDVLQYAKEQLVGESIQKVHQPSLEKVGENFSLVTTMNSHRYESEMIIQNGERIPVEVSVRRIRYSGNESLQWVLRDIRERIDLEILKNDLVAMVYHDLRSPLANVTASLDILSSHSNTDRDETTANLLTIAMRSSDRIQRLLNSLLDVYRLEAGQNIVNRDEVQPAWLIKETVDLLQPTLDAKGQVVRIDVPEDLPVISVDVDMIRRVLVNLVENASKFSPVDSEIFIQAQKAEGTVLFSVKDQGPGIPVEDQKVIFEKFSRLKTTNGAKGIGLGLTFCRLSVVGHGGKIWVESTPEEGSCFYFSLPVQNMADRPA